MKRILVLLTPILLFMPVLTAQTIEQANKYLYYERYTSARLELHRMLAGAGENPDIYYWMGEIFLEQKIVDSARWYLSEGIRISNQQNLAVKQYPLVHLGWAHLLLDSGVAAEGKRQMENVLSSSKYKDNKALLAAAKANIASKHGDIPWALELLEKAKKGDKHKPEILVAEGDAHRRMFNGSEAIKSYDAALRLDPGYAQALYRKGMIYKTQDNAPVYVDLFTRAVMADSAYAPALYELYYYYFDKDVKKAAENLYAYFRHTDPDPYHPYMEAEYLYISGNHQQTIRKAKEILENTADKAEARLHKMIAYAQAALADTTTAIENMKVYFDKQAASNIVRKDFEFMAILQGSKSGNKNLAADWYQKALNAEQGSADRLQYLEQLAKLENELGNRDKEAYWREQIFLAKENPGNLDVYNWGMALYAAGLYEKADSVFSIYEQEYPEQLYGYLWRARCNALIDTSMEKGLAVPHYIKLIEVASQDSVKNKPILVKAYNYLAIYEANIKNDNLSSLKYFNKILLLDPENKDALKYFEILSRRIEAAETSAKADENN